MHTILTTILPSQGLLKRRVLARWRLSKICINYDESLTMAANHELAAKLLATECKILNKSFEESFIGAESAESENSYYWIKLKTKNEMVKPDAPSPIEASPLDGISQDFVDMFNLSIIKDVKP